jgi:MoaA/NifB/PqqE/SkfB family radical SAM enzyme
MEFYPSPFVTMRSSPSAVAFCDLFTGRQLVLKGSAGCELAAVFNRATTLESFLSKYPTEAEKAVSLSLLTDDPSQDPYLRSMLSSIDIEPAGSCNAVCGMCPRASMTRPKTVMSTETFDAVCRQLGETFPSAIQKVFFCGFGEPLQNPQLPEMSRRVRAFAPHASISVISNGSLLSDSLIESLVASEINLFSCSFQSNTKRRYESIMGGLNFDSTNAGLKKLIAAARGTKLAVCISITATEDNSSEIPQMVAAWEKQGAQVVVNSLHNRGGHLTIEGRHRPGDKPVARCGLTNSRLFISSEGEILSCCHDLGGETRIGNINTGPLIEILKRKLSRIARSELYSICGKCDDDSAQVPVPLSRAITASL